MILFCVIPTTTSFNTRYRYISQLRTSVDELRDQRSNRRYRRIDPLDETSLTFIQFETFDCYDIFNLNKYLSTLYDTKFENFRPHIYIVKRVNACHVSAFLHYQLQKKIYIYIYINRPSTKERGKTFGRSVASIAVMIVPVFRRNPRRRGQFLRSVTGLKANVTPPPVGEYFTIIRGEEIRVGKESEGGRRIRVRQTIDSRWAEIVLAGTGGGAAKVGGAEGKRALAYQLPGCARLPGGARMIYSVIEHPCRCGRNSMATPTVWNVRAAPAASATTAVTAADVVTTTTTITTTTTTTTATAAATGMFMLLPLCLYLVAVLALRCSSSAVPATDAAAVVAAVVAAVAATATVTAATTIVGRPLPFLVPISHRAPSSLSSSYLRFIPSPAPSPPPFVHYR